MKTSITDQFLWDIYNLIEKGENVVYFISQGRKAFYNYSGLKNPIFEKYRKTINKRKFSKLVYYLKKNNYIKVKNLKGNKTISLTKKGENKVFKARFKVNSQYQKRKDNKWIMVIFDIPQKQWKARNLLKSILHNLKYRKFQQSVWVTPYDVFEKTEQLLQYYSLEKYVRIFLIEEL